MNALDEIIALRQLHELKGRYCRCLDTRDWDGFADVFTPDGTLRNIETEVTGRDEIVRYVRSRLDGTISVHQSYLPELTVAEVSATGIWAMADYIERADGTGFRGYGHYHERYQLDGRWRLAECHLVRLRVDSF